MSDRNAHASAEAEHIETAREAGLRYVTDDSPGIRRRRCGKGFTYVDRHGDTVQRAAVRDRIAELVIPPAWEEVWICPRDDGHIQATGRDQEGRKQYLYHERWRAIRDREKYVRLADFGTHLPTLRRRVSRDLATSGLTLDRVAAGAVRLLDRGALRVGSEAYTRDNESFGLTTLRKSHVRLSGGRIRLEFEAKGGKERVVELRDVLLARLVSALRRAPGELLWVHRNGTGNGNGNGNGNGDGLSPLRPEQVNEYLRTVTDADISAKDFRTWAGSLAALRVLAAASGGTKRDAEGRDRDATVLEALDAAAESLGNIRSTARSFYVHPGLITAFEAEELEGLIERHGAAGPRKGLRAGEALLLALLPHLDPDVPVD